MLKILLAVKESIKNRGYGHTFHKIRVIFKHGLRHPNLIFRYINASIQTEFSAINCIRQFIKLDSCAYATNLSFPDRVNMFICHITFLHSRFWINNYLKNGVRLWSLSDTKNIEIYLLITENWCSNEGELSLTVHIDNRPVFIFSFIICDGGIFKTVGHVLFLTRIQGVQNEYPSIKYANKLMGNLNLPNALLSAANGLALSLGIGKIISVSSSNQLSSKSDGSRKNFSSTYDQFLLKNGASSIQDGYFSLPVPLPTKELNSDRTHRSRHKKHLAIRSEISQKTIKAFQKLILN